MLLRIRERGHGLRKGGYAREHVRRHRTIALVVSTVTAMRMATSHVVAVSPIVVSMAPIARAMVNGGR
jgi:hypothetical protein